MWRKTGAWGFGETAEGTAEGTPGFCAESLFHIADTLFPGWIPRLLMPSTWRNEIAPPSGLPVTPTCVAHTLLRSQLPGPGCRGQGRLRGYQWLSCVALGQGPFPSLSHPVNLTRGTTFPTSPILQDPSGPTLRTLSCLTLLSSISLQNLGQTELYSSKMGTIFPL